MPIHRKVEAQLLRSTVGATALLMNEQLDIPSHSVLRFNDALLQFVGQKGRKVFFRHASGTLETCGTLHVTFNAVTEGEILHEFDRFWRPFWQRDRREEQFQEDTWGDFLTMLESSNLPKLPAITFDLDDIGRWMSLIRKLPSNKAVGPCGWSNEELKCLPKKCIIDLVRIYNLVLQDGFSTNMMMAKTILLSKKESPQSMHDARPVTILSCLYRLFGKMVFQTVAHAWKGFLKRVRHACEEAFGRGEGDHLIAPHVKKRKRVVAAAPKQT